MTSINLPAALSERLYQVARRQGHSMEECAIRAIRSYVEDWEDSARTASQMNGHDQVVRLSDGFCD